MPTLDVSNGHDGAFQLHISAVVKLWHGERRSVVRGPYRAPKPSGSSSCANARAYSAQVKGWIYSEQAELMRLYLERPASSSEWVLDYKQVLFHPNFWYTSGWDMRVLPDGRIHNKHTGSTPAFLHYNGDSKHTWKGVHSPRALARSLRAIYTARTSDVTLSNLEAFLPDISFLSPTFARDSTVGWQQVCSQGSIEGEGRARGA